MCRIVANSEFLSKLRQATQSASPVDEIEKVFQEMQARGIKPRVAYATFALVLEEESNEDVREMLADQMDRFVGWCAPSQKYQEPAPSRKSSSHD